METQRKKKSQLLFKMRKGKMVTAPATQVGGESRPYKRGISLSAHKVSLHSGSRRDRRCVRAESQSQ